MDTLEQPQTLPIIPKRRLLIAFFICLTLFLLVLLVEARYKVLEEFKQRRMDDRVMLLNE